MSETPDDFLDEVLLPGDYQAELRRIAEQSAPTPELGGAKRKTIPDFDDEDSDDVEVEVAVGAIRPMSYDYEVQTPSGARLPVLTEGEVEYYEDRTQRYTTDHKFTSVTDLQDLDRVLSTELMLHRYDVWLALGNDYWGQAVSERDLLRYVKDLSATLQALKKSMGLDKATRDKDQGADFVSWLDDVRRRAKEFQVMRNKQFEMSITLFHELIAKLQLMNNCDEIERKELGMFPEDVLRWIETDLVPRFTIIDEHFRREGPDAQRYWIADL